MSNEFVMVPLELAEVAARALSSNGYDLQARDLEAALVQRHQVEPAALPMRRSWSGIAGWKDQAEIKAWNACIDEIAKLGPLYTHADPGEADRLREEIQSLRKTLPNSTTELVDLRAQLAETQRISQEEELRANRYSQQLAERDALLREVINGKSRTQFDGDLMHRILMTLSASAEPSAPECKACHDQGEVFVRKGDVHYGMQTEPEPIMAACRECAEPSAPKCNYCGDTGQIMVGRSGDANDGNAPIMEPCEDCDRGAPVERDERAAFDAWTVRQGRVVGYLGWREDFAIWQAALEHKS